MAKGDKPPKVKEPKFTDAGGDWAKLQSTLRDIRKGTLGRRRKKRGA